jgi:hypothetical protein
VHSRLGAGEGRIEAAASPLAVDGGVGVAGERGRWYWKLAVAR